MFLKNLNNKCILPLYYQGPTHLYQKNVKSTTRKKQKLNLCIKKNPNMLCGLRLASETNIIKKVE